MNIFEVWPGPMEGVGKEEFVKAASVLHLTDRWMTPFVRIADNIPSDSKLRRMLQPYLSSGLPVEIQVMGDDPCLLGKCGRKLLDYPHVTGININCGCPSGRVVKHHAGGVLLKNPEMLAGFCSEIAARLPSGKLSVKLRSGFDDYTDMEIFLPQLTSCGCVNRIFFHYRSVTEGYSPCVLPQREMRISRAVELCGDVPLIANGDISSVEEANELVAKTGCAGVMIARPWMQDPFLLRRFCENVPDAEEGRRLFFAELQKCGVGGGALIEFVKMLWGRNSEQFRAIIDTEGNLEK